VTVFYLVMKAAAMCSGEFYAVPRATENAEHQQTILHSSAQVVIDMMRDVYPDLVEKASYITKVILNEEQRFMETLDSGLRILQEETAALKKAGKNVLSGALVFKLYDTFGFPTDLTADIVKKDNFTLDTAGFEAEMEQQRKERAVPGKAVVKKPLRNVT